MVLAASYSYSSREQRKRKRKEERKKQRKIKSEDYKKERKGHVGWLHYAPVDVRTDVARKGGTAPHKKRGIGAIEDPAKRQVMARKGGLARKSQLGANYREFYSALGKKGGDAVLREHGRDWYVANGRKGKKKQQEQTATLTL